MDKNGVGHTPLDQAVADQLLTKLSSDDDFRALFSSDPAAALRALGVDDDAAAAAVAGQSCLCTRQLASKEEIAATQKVLQDYLTSQGTHTVVYAFELGETAAKLKQI